MARLTAKIVFCFFISSFNSYLILLVIKSINFTDTNINSHILTFSIKKWSDIWFLFVMNCVSIFRVIYSRIRQLEFWIYLLQKESFIAYVSAFGIRQYPNNETGYCITDLQISRHFMFAEIDVLYIDWVI